MVPGQFQRLPLRPLSLSSTRASKQGNAAGNDDAFPLLDLHAHLDNSSIDPVVRLAQEPGVRLGIVEHAGTEENKYPRGAQLATMS